MRCVSGVEGTQVHTTSFFYFSSVTNTVYLCALRNNPCIHVVHRASRPSLFRWNQRLYTFYGWNPCDVSSIITLTAVITGRFYAMFQTPWCGAITRGHWRYEGTNSDVCFLYYYYSAASKLYIALLIFSVKLSKVVMEILKWVAWNCEPFGVTLSPKSLTKYKSVLTEASEMCELHVIMQVLLTV